MTKHRLHYAVSQMMSIFERGSALPIHERFYEVRLHTKGTTLTLVEYTNKGGSHTGHQAAENAKKFLIEEITNQLHETIESMP